MDHISQEMVPDVYGSLRTRMIVVAIAWLLWHLTSSAHATVLDWSQSYAAWTAGTPSVGSTATQDFDNDPSHAGNDVAISITNQNVKGWNDDIQTSSTPISDGGIPADVSLQLLPQRTGSPNPGSGFLVTINFSGYAYGVTDATFKLLNIDSDPASRYTDVITGIAAVTVAGITNSTDFSVVGSSGNSVSLSGSSYVVTGDSQVAWTSSGGNVVISYTGTNAIQQLQFQWYNSLNKSGGANVGIALGDISYRATPEVAPGFAAVGLCMAAVGLRWIRRGKRRVD